MRLLIFLPLVFAILLDDLFIPFIRPISQQLNTRIRSICFKLKHTQQKLLSFSHENSQKPSILTSKLFITELVARKSLMIAFSFLLSILAHKRNVLGELLIIKQSLNTTNKYLIIEGKAFFVVPSYFSLLWK